VVALADEPIAVGDVLMQMNHMPSPEQRLQISSRFQGRTAITSLTLSDEVAHGDVLTLSRGNKSGLKGFGSLVPSYSEWQETVAAPPLPETPGPEAFRIAAPGVLPEENSPGLLMSMPTSSEAAADDASGPAAPQTDPFAASVAADVAPTSAVQLVSQANPAFDSDGPIVAPHPPIEYPELTDTVDTAKASGDMSPWNLVFIGGLLLAGTLILAASLRADPEPETDQQRTRVQPSEQTIAFAAAEKTVDRTHSENSIETESSATQTPVHISPTAVTFADAVHHTSALALREAVQTEITPSSLVSINEWFGKDWLNSRPQPGAQSVVSRQSADELVTQVSSIEEGRAEQGTKVSAPATTPELPQLIEQSVAETLSSVAKDSSDLQMNGFADLEDLLQNRLPIDLCSTRLPLRIALFGRPAGPRRLRIDAAHTTLPAPHMNRSAERGREKPVMASESTAAADSRDGAVADSLDRALHNLQKRTDS
jgi:hypothetical protein